MLWKAILALCWIPLVMGHAIWVWQADGTLTTYWMLCVCALCVAYAIQWISANLSVERSATVVKRVNPERPRSANAVGSPDVA